MSAAIVASPDMIFKAGELVASTRGTIGCRQQNHATNAATPAAAIAAISLEPVSPIAAANAKIPKAQASDNAISTCAVLAGWLVWAGMNTPSNRARAS